MMFFTVQIEIRMDFFPNACEWDYKNLIPLYHIWNVTRFDEDFSAESTPKPSSIS